MSSPPENTVWNGGGLLTGTKLGRWGLQFWRGGIFGENRVGKLVKAIQAGLGQIFCALILNNSMQVSSAALVCMRE